MPAPEDQQSEVVRFLSDPASHGPGCTNVEVVATHGARVFLAAGRAVKIKRAVAYDYMDFSSLEKRRAALEKEYAINRPHAPGIYDRVVAITRTTTGGLTFGGSGEIVEWALLMHRFDQAALLSAIVERGTLDIALAEKVADAIAAYHDASAPVTDSPTSVRFAAIIDHLARSGLADPALAPRADVDRWAGDARAHLGRVAGLLDQRARTGAVRLAHGDLHLANIVILDGRPVLFDAIEFDDRLRTVDRLYDLAFLLMDLEMAGAHQPANTILNRYIARPGAHVGHAGNGDLDALAALPLLLSLRAQIRAMVATQRANLQCGERRAAALREARTYFDRACRHLHPARPRLIAIGGLSGTGKTTLARALAPGIPPMPGAIILRSDIERKRLFDHPETEHLPPAAYTKDTSAKVYDALAAKAARVLAAGHSVILDAVFSEPAERDMAARIAREAGAPFTGLWLEAPPATLRARVEARRGDASDADAAVVDLQLARGSGPVLWPHIPAGSDPSATLTAARTVVAAAPGHETIASQEN